MAEPKWFPIIAIVGILCLVLGIYSVLKPAEISAQPTGPVASNPCNITKRVPPPQPKVTSRDLRGKYGIVLNVIFNQKTRVVFTTPQEFFNETGLTSFEGVQTDRFKKLPRDCVFVDGTPLTERDYNMLELNR
jgi:hypothetical protein